MTSFSFRMRDLFPRQSGAWWRTASSTSVLLRALEQSGLWLDYDRWGDSTGVDAALPVTVENTAKGLHAFESGAFDVYSAARSAAGTPAVRLTFTLLTGRSGLLLEINAPVEESIRATLLMRVETFIQALAEAGMATAVAGPACTLGVFELPYARPRPPRFDHSWMPGSVLHVFNRELIKANPESARRLAVALEAPLPSGATCGEAGDLVWFRWADTLVDDSALAKRLSVAEQWLAETLELPVAFGYAANGDAEQTLLESGKRSTLTIFDAATGTGYIAAVPAPDGSLAPETIERIRTVASTRTLDDGTGVGTLFIILPSRAAALGFMNQARSYGADGVVYADNDGRLWNPDPPGEWIVESS